MLYTRDDHNDDDDDDDDNFLRLSGVGRDFFFANIINYS